MSAAIQMATTKAKNEQHTNTNTNTNTWEMGNGQYAMGNGQYAMADVVTVHTSYLKNEQVVANRIAAGTFRPEPLLRLYYMKRKGPIGKEGSNGC
jgi:hypothetical protein